MPSKTTKKKKKKKVPVRQVKVVLPTEKTTIAMDISGYIFLVYGPPGVGKTTFVEDLTARTLFISTDRGTRYMPTLRLEVNNYDELLRAIKTLEVEGANDKYDVICLDHIDDICTMIDDHTCKTLGVDALGDVGFAKGWKLYKKNIWAILQRLLRLETGVGLIAHETITTIKTKVIETQRIMPEMGKSPWKVIIPKCDLDGCPCAILIKIRVGKIR